MRALDRLSALALLAVLALAVVAHCRRHRAQLLIAGTRLCQLSAAQIGRAGIACEDALRGEVTA